MAFLFWKQKKKKIKKEHFAVRGKCEARKKVEEIIRKNQQGGAEIKESVKGKSRKEGICNGGKENGETR